MFSIKCLSPRLNHSLRSCSSWPTDQKTRWLNQQRKKFVWSHSWMTAWPASSHPKSSGRPTRAKSTWTWLDFPSPTNWSQAAAEYSPTPEDGHHPLQHYLGAMAGRHLLTTKKNPQEQDAGVGVSCDALRHHRNLTSWGLTWGAQRAPTSKIEPDPQHQRGLKGIH